MSSKIDQKDINNAAWAACDTFRGVVDPAQYKDYILVMLFLKYISDVWQDHYETYQKQYGSDDARILRKMERERFVLPVIKLTEKNRESGEEVLLEQFGVEGRDAVDRVAADDGDVGHADHLDAAFLDERHGPFLFRIAGVGGLDGLDQALVDLEDQLQMTGQDFLEKRNAPFLQRFRQNRMIGVAATRLGNFKGIFPGAVKIFC